MKIPILVIAVLTFAVTGMGQSTFNSTVGIAESLEKGPCLTIRNARLKAGQTVQVVLTGKPQSVVNATVKAKLTAECNENGENEKASFYSLRMRKHDPFAGLGVVSTRRIGVSKGVASADLNRDGKKEYFRECTSSEGAHLTVWTGKPLVGKRVYRGYVYVGYDTEKTCNKKDYQ